MATKFPRRPPVPVSGDKLPDSVVDALGNWYIVKKPLVPDADGYVQLIPEVAPQKSGEGAYWRLVEIDCNPDRGRLMTSTEVLDWHSKYEAATGSRDDLSLEPFLAWLSSTASPEVAEAARARIESVPL